MYAKLHSFGLLGMDAFPVEVEADLSQGLPAFDIVGLPDASVKESRDRVRAALKNLKFTYPVSRITINLAPADVKKAGPLYDLPILLSILLASEQFKGDFQNSAFLGELSLTGEIRPVSGVLPMVIAAKERGLDSVFLPLQNGQEASIVQGITLYGVRHIHELLDHFSGEAPLAPLGKWEPATFAFPPMPDFSEVKGQWEAKRALEVAAAGGHNVLLIGAPGSGKSMLAKRLPSILPEMTFAESIESTKVHSIAGLLREDVPLITQRPFRAPHHTVTPAGLTGGGSIPRPGEISLAHNGVLFLDELPEFNRPALEVLRQPIEDRRVTITRASATLTYPCSAMVVAAMNPCPCGYFGHPTRPCTCTPSQVSRYLSRVSGPLLDRMDIQIEVLPVEYESLTSQKEEEPSSAIRKRVNAAREVQEKRYADFGLTCNARLTADMLQKVCPLTKEADVLLHGAFDKLGLSARAYDRILKVSRTIADLEGAETIEASHIAEAIQYRSLDKKYWVR